MTNKTFLDVFQHLCFMRFVSFMSTYMVCVTTCEYTTQVAENTGLPWPPRAAPLCASQCLTFAATWTDFPCNFLKQGLGKLSAGRKRTRGQCRSLVQQQEMQGEQHGTNRSLCTLTHGSTWETISKEQKIAHSFACGAVSKRGQWAPWSDVCIFLLWSFALSEQPSYNFWAWICK